MAIFVVSLSLPHTISFNVDKKQLDAEEAKSLAGSEHSSYEAPPLLNSNLTFRHKETSPAPTSNSLIQSLVASTTTSRDLTPNYSPPNPSTIATPLYEADDIFFPSNNQNNSKKPLSKLSSYTELTSESFGIPKKKKYLQPRSKAEEPPTSKNVVRLERHKNPAKSSPVAIKIEPIPKSARSTIIEELQKDLSGISLSSKYHSRNSSNDLGSLFSKASWSIVKNNKGNGGLRKAVYRAIRDSAVKDVKWIGTFGMPSDSLNEETTEAIVNSLKTNHNEIAVVVSDTTFDGAYKHFCKQILWPTLHYQIPDNPKSKAYEDHSWIHYYNLNNHFAKVIYENYKPGDTIWIHDYHLFLVPAMVRKLLPNAKIGFFHHVAFPSSEVFRCLPSRSQLLNGILGADYIGFQTQEYVMHFLQTCNRLLCVEVREDGIRLDDKFITVDSNPIGIDTKELAVQLNNEEVFKWRDLLRKRWDGKYIIAARDKLDYIRGIRQKLLGYEAFLIAHPEWISKTVLIQIGLSDASSFDIEAEISEICDRINSLNPDLSSHSPVVFLRQDIDFEQYLALITEANVFAVTCLREGMNLTCHEYIFAQQENKGPLILSEFTGSASVLGDNCLLVNPWYTEQVANAFETALTMSESKKEANYSKLYNFITTHTCKEWVTQNLSSLDKAWSNARLRAATNIPMLKLDYVRQSFFEISALEYRFITLDYGGTLVPWGHGKSSLYSNPARATEIVRNLIISDPRNVVYVTTSLMAHEIDRIFKRVPKVGLIAENGCFLRPFNSEIWINLTENSEYSWMDSVNLVLRSMSERLPGSYVIAKSCSLVFHIEEAEDQGRAATVAGECINHVNEQYNGMGVHAIMSDGAILVERTDHDKSKALEIAWKFARHSQSLNSHHSYHHSAGFTVDNSTDPGSSFVNFSSIEVDESSKNPKSPAFILAVGDAEDDECVFEWANKLEKQIKTVITATVVQHSTSARVSLNGISGLLQTLSNLCKTDKPFTEI